MSVFLDCGCNFRCRCDARVAADKAVVLLKMVGLEASAHVNCYDDGISLSLQPYEYFYTYKGRGFWSLAHLRHITYRSAEGLEKGVNRLIQRKNANPDYLELPKVDAKGRFHLQNGSALGRYCRSVQKK